MSWAFAAKESDCIGILHTILILCAPAQCHSRRTDRFHKTSGADVSHSKALPEPKIALDGPSALTFYRDRCEQESTPWQTPPPEPFEVDSDGDIWLSDEDVAATLSTQSVFGRSDEFEASATASGMRMPTLRRSNMQRLAQCAMRSKDLKLVPYETLGVQPPSHSSPLFILVPNPNSKRRVTCVSQRAYTHPIARYSFTRVEDSVYVPCPEFTYALMAHYLTLPGLMLLAMELCGHYRLVGALSRNPLQAQRILYNQQPLTTTARLRSFVDKCGPFSGRKSAMRALAHVANDAASPMESVVYLLLCLPRSLGGYGLSKPILNAKRPVTELAGKLTMANHLIPDLYWPEQRLDVEYDSDEFHSSPTSLTAGARRTMALRLMQVEVVSLTYDIVCDVDALDATARLVARRLGQRVYPTNAQAATAREALRDALLRKRSMYKPRLERMQ